MSRFWAAGESSSDSDSESDSSDSDESQIAGVGTNANVGTGNTAADSKWKDLSDESSDDDAVRVVKSAKDRFLLGFDSSISTLRTAMKQRDYNTISTVFDELAKSMIKAKAVLAQGIPKSLVRILVDLEDYVTERLLDKAAFKTLSASQGRSLNRMKLTLKKHNKPYAMVIEAYKKNPVVDDDDDEEEENEKEDKDSDDSDDDDDDDESADSDAKGSSSSSDSDSDSDSDADSDADSDDESQDEWASDKESSDSDDEDAGLYSELKGRARWLKKNTVVKEKVVKDKEARGRLRKATKEATTNIGDEGATKSILSNVTPSLLTKKVNELVASRGRRGTDTRQVLRQLEALSKLSLEFGPRVEVPILMLVITSQFDLQRTMDDYMPTATWQSCANYLHRVTTLVEDEYTLGQVTEDETIGLAFGGNVNKAVTGATGVLAAAEAALVNPHTNEEETEDERAERLRLETEANMTEEEKKVIPVMGSLAMFLNRLEEEYVKSLQHISPHTGDYVTRLRDETKLVDLLSKGQEYYARVHLEAEAATLAQLRIEHIYYRHDSTARQVDKAAEFYKKFGDMDMLHPACVTCDTAPTDRDVEKTHPAAFFGKPILESAETKEYNSVDLIGSLCSYVYQYGTDRGKTRAMICHIYHHALHDRFSEARDLLLMSHLQDTITNSGDVSTMILFNRMMVNLGMAAFRLGKIWSAHQCLAEICSGRVRELLAQGVSTGRFNDKTADQEKAEKRRQVPYHQHINLDLLESCHLISAMLLEVPNMASSDDRRTRVISRTFRKHHDIYERQVFTGPPEQTRDFIMRASKALRKGDWKTCSDYLSGMDVWKLVPGDNAAESIKKMLLDSIKLEGLRTYLFTFSSQYDSLSLTQLCGMFELSKSEVHSIVSKMMINRDLFASWDQPTETIVLRKVEPSSLQLMALQFAEKAASLVEANERLLEATSGSSGYKDENWQGGHRDGGGNQGRGGYQGRGGGGGRGGGRGGGGRSGGRGAGGGGGRAGGRGGGRNGGRGSGRGGGRGGGYRENSENRYNNN